MNTCNRCLQDPRVVSKDGTRRQCALVLGEVTVSECDELRDKMRKAARE